MVLEEPLGGEGPARLGGCGLGGEFECPPQPVAVRCPVDVAGYELQRRLPVCRAALVVDRHPAREIGPVVAGVQHHHVVGLPGDPAGQIGRLDPLGCRRLVPQQPDERRLGHQILRERGKDDVSVMAHVDLAVDVVHGAVGAEERRLQVGAVPLVEAHLSPHVLLHELLAREKVVLVVLLQDLQPLGIGQRLEVDSRRVDQRGDIHELDLAAAASQADLADVLHEAQVAVVDRQGQVALVLGGDGLSAGVRPRPGRPADGKTHDQGEDNQHASHRSLLLVKWIGLPG